MTRHGTRRFCSCISIMHAYCAFVLMQIGGECANQFVCGVVVSSLLFSLLLFVITSEMLLAPLVSLPLFKSSLEMSSIPLSVDFVFGDVSTFFECRFVSFVSFVCIYFGTWMRNFAALNRKCVAHQKHSLKFRHLSSALDFLHHFCHYSSLRRRQSFCQHRLWHPMQYPSWHHLLYTLHFDISTLRLYRFARATLNWYASLIILWSLGFLAGPYFLRLMCDTRHCHLSTGRFFRHSSYRISLLRYFVSKIRYFVIFQCHRIVALGL